MRKERNSSVELLRIISMLIIVWSHFCVHGGFEAREMNFSFNKILLQVGDLGSLGVVIFVMISGYFLSQTSFKLSRLVKIILQVTFYSLSVYLILVLLKIVRFSGMEAISAIFPILFNYYWFATAYVVLCIISPFLNILLNRFTQKQYIFFLSVLLLIWSVIPTFTRQSLGGNDICQFVMFYSIGAFARKYPDIPAITKNRYWIAGISAFLLVMSTVTMGVLAIKFPFFNHGNFFYLRNSVLVIPLAYALLLIFTNFEGRSNRFINTVSSTAFGIYLIHDNMYLRKIIWYDILNVNRYKESPYLILYLMLCVITVFVVCGIIDYIRQKLLEKPLMNLLEPPLDRLSNRFLALCDYKL